MLLKFNLKSNLNTKAKGKQNIDKKAYLVKISTSLILIFGLAFSSTTNKNKTKKQIQRKFIFCFCALPISKYNIFKISFVFWFLKLFWKHRANNKK